MTPPEIILGILKALAAALEEYKRHAEEVTDAKAKVATQAASDLAAVDKPN